MAKYGIPYMGSKDKISDDILSVLPRGKRRIPPVYGELAQAPSGCTPRGLGSIPPGLHQPHDYPPDSANPRHLRL